MTATSRIAKDRLGSVAIGLSLALAFAPVAHAEPEPEPEPAADSAEGPAAEATAATQVAVLPVASAGKLDKPIRRQLAAGLVEGLQRGGFDVIPPAEVYKAYPDSIEACDSLACYAEVSAATGATHTVRAEVTVQRKDYRFDLELYDVDNQSVVAKLSDTCEVCGGQDAAQLLADLGAGLSRDLNEGMEPAVLQIDSQPPGATVFIDDVEVGQAPVELELAAGKHRMRVEKPGFAPQSRDIEVAGGVRESYSVSLAELIEAPQAKPIPAWPGWAMVGLGGGGVVAGVVLIALDEQPIRGRCSGDDVDEMGNCRFRHNTLPLGLAVTVGGVVMAAAGTTLLLVRHRRGRLAGKAARIRPTLDGFAVRF